MEAALDQTSEKIVVTNFHRCGKVVEKLDLELFLRSQSVSGLTP